MNFTSFKYPMYFFREKAMTLQSEIYSGRILHRTLQGLRSGPWTTDCSQIKYKRFYLEKAYSTNFCNNKVSNSISNSNIFFQFKYNLNMNKDSPSSWLKNDHEYPLIFCQG